MGNYDSDFISVKGKVDKVKLNVKKEKSSGGFFRANILWLDVDGDVEKFVISTKSKAGPYLEKLKPGQEVTVKQKDDKFKTVVAVFDNSFSKKGYGDKKGGFQKKEYDPTGPIQGMILASATNAVALTADSLGGLTAERIVETAKEILTAKETVDELVRQALKSRGQDNDTKETDEDDSEEDETDDQEADEEDEDEETSSRKKTKKSHY